MDNNVSVLIVGAGPTGLMMACELARHGVEFRIIDKKSKPTTESNATWIQTRTLEILDFVGLAPNFLEVGHRCNSINLYIKGKPLTTIPFEHVNSLYPFILMLAQSETEKLLNDCLGQFNNKVERSTALIKLEQIKDKVVSTVRLPNNKEEVIVSDWLIACDGANSTVREKLNIFFPGEDLAEQFVVADAVIDSFKFPDEINVFFDKHTIFLASPFGSSKYRITTNLHLEHKRQYLYPGDIVNIVQERGYGEYYVKDVSWISPFWIHGKMAKKMRIGSVILAGDAAHIHSPLGGQGMNLGIQDAFNLAWKLSLVINRQAKESLLDSYHDERSQATSKVVKTTEKFTKMCLSDKNFLSNLRKYCKNTSNKKLQRIATEISQTNIRYTKSNLITKVASPKPRAGERAPDVMINEKSKLYDYLTNTKFNILLFTAELNKNINLNKLTQLQQWLDTYHSDLIASHIITRINSYRAKNLIVDQQLNIHKIYNVKKPTIIIIRPDNYITYRSVRFDKKSVKSAFKKYLNI